MASTAWSTWRSAVVAMVATAFCTGGGAAVDAAIVGPYTVDGDTLQLWHMDDGTGATTAANAVPAGAGVINMQGVLNGATLGSTAVSGFGTSIDVAAGATSIVSSGNPPTVAPHRAILLGAPHSRLRMASPAAEIKTSTT